MELTADIINFLELKDTLCYHYIHRTHSEEVGNAIIKSGFQFTDSFNKTTDEIINDPVYLNYWLKSRNEYGDLVICINISRRLMKHYENLIQINNSHFISEIQQVLTNCQPHENDDGEFVFTLDPHFIKGYYHLKTQNIVLNPHYNPDYDTKKFEKNIRTLRKLI